MKSVGSVIIMEEMVLSNIYLIYVICFALSIFKSLRSQRFLSRSTLIIRVSKVFSQLRLLMMILAY